MPTPESPSCAARGWWDQMLGGWCVSTCPATAHRPTLRPLEGFTAGFLFPLAAAYKHLGMTEMVCAPTINTPRSFRV